MTKAFLSGKRLALHGLKPDDFHINRMVDWLNDNEVTKLLIAGLLPANPEDIREAWKSNIQNPNEVVFMVYSGPVRDKFVGTAGLYLIDWVARSTEYRIFLGNKEFWGEGLGTEVTKCIVKYAFEKLNLHSVYLGVNLGNKAAVRVYEKAGFVHEGTYRQVVYRNGQYYDAWHMSILREEYFA